MLRCIVDLVEKNCAMGNLTVTTVALLVTLLFGMVSAFLVKIPWGDNFRKESTEVEV